MQNIEYYKSHEVLSHKFFPLPQELLYNPIYRGKLSSDTIILYTLLLDRLTLSIKNNWVDENNNIYLIYTREAFAELLSVSYKTAIKSFKELIQAGLITEKKQGMGKPNLIFVAKVKHSNKTCNIYTSIDAKSEVNDMSNLHTINTNNTNTNIINPLQDNITIDEVKEQCSLNDFENKDKVILEGVINKLYNSKILKVNGLNITQAEIKNKLKLISKNNLIHLIDVIKSNTNIKNLNSYLVSTLYNNLGNEYNTRNKTSSSYSQREYSKEFLESLYSNI